MTRVTGIHHVTAMAGDPIANFRFYTHLLGLRLVKKTVNFDAPDVYHLYFGDRTGRPGTVMTFFPEPSNPPGRPGVGEVARTLFAVPAGSLDWWRDRLVGFGVAVADRQSNGSRQLHLADHDGTRLALVEQAGEPGDPPVRPDIPAERAIVGFAGVSLLVPEVESTGQFLVERLGLARIGGETGRAWFQTAAGGQLVEVVAEAATARARLGAGSVHHVAFRVPDDATQVRLREDLVEAGTHVSQVMDRSYFHSIYFREPGGVICEVATDVPGFTTDESVEALGSGLMLPPQYEPMRSELERHLVPLEVG